MKKFLRFVKDNIFNFLFLVLGVWLGIRAGYISRTGIGGYVFLIIIGILVSFGMQINYLPTNVSKVIGLFVGFALSFPFAYFMQYVVAFVRFGIGIAKFFFGIPILGPIAAVILMAIVGYVVYFIIDSIITAKGVKK